MEVKRKLSRKDILLFSTGNFGISIINATILGFVLFFYLTEGLTGVSLPPVVIGSIVGFALMVGRIVDAFVNPVVGWLSDNTHWNKWGRRRPFVLVGLIPMTIAFVLVFNPPIFVLQLFPDMGEVLLILYLFIIISVFDGLFTFVFVPIYALMPEIAPTSAERVRLSVWGNIFAMLANIVGFVIAPIMFDNYGFSLSSIYLGIIVFITIVVVLLIEETPFEEIQEKISLKESLLLSIRNSPYRIFLVNQIGMQFSFRIMSAIMPFFAVSVLYLSLSDTMIITIPYIGVAIISFPIWEKITGRLGKKRAFEYSMILFTLPLLIVFSFLVVKDFPLNIILCFIMVGIMGFGIGGLWIYPPTIIGDIVDDEERRLGLRRESMYYSFQEFTEKLAISIAVLLEGIILGLFVVETIPHPDYPPSLNIQYYIYDPLGPVLLMGVVAFIPMIIALLVFRRFPNDLIIE